MDGPRAVTDTDDTIAASLIEANRRLKSIQAAKEIATWNWDIVNNRVVGDENLARLFGVSAQDAAGSPIEKYLPAIHPDDRISLKAAISKALEGTSDKHETNFRVVRSDGEISWVAASGTIERSDDGSPRNFQGVLIDISELRSSERRADELSLRLEKQSRILDITLSSISDFAYILDRKGRFAFVNQALLDLWGLTFKEAVGKNFFELKYPEELATRLQQQIEKVFTTKEGLTDETEYTSQTGAGGYYEYIFRPVFDREGNVELVAGSTRDITDRKRVEAELRASQERYRTLAESLESQVQARTRELEQRTSDVVLQSELLSGLSSRLMKTQDEERRRIAREMHDSAGQTIVALSMAIDQIQRTLDPSNQKLIGLTQEADSLLRDLGQEIRTTSYLLHPPLLDELGLREALGWYVDGLRQRSGIEIQLSVDEFQRLPNEIELTVFRVVQECLTNIHRHSGSKIAQIDVAAKGDDLIVKVRDFGSGISEEVLAKIRNRGVGVGFRGMRERVRPFAGDVRIESQVGVGTAVTITLPNALAV